MRAEWLFPGGAKTMILKSRNPFSEWYIEYSSALIGISCEMNSETISNARSAGRDPIFHTLSVGSNTAVTLCFYILSPLWFSYVADRQYFFSTYPKLPQKSLSLVSAVHIANMSQTSYDTELQSFVTFLTLMRA